jgi:hypothetical protein
VLLDTQTATGMVKLIVGAIRKAMNEVCPHCNNKLNMKTELVELLEELSAKIDAQTFPDDEEIPAAGPGPINEPPA